MKYFIPVLLTSICLATISCRSHPTQVPVFKSPYAAWENGPSKDEEYFPIGVWCQEPEDAATFKKIGINLYVSLWDGPTEKQLSELRRAGMPVICDQNKVGLKHRDDSLIIGWMQPDEPDIAQMQPNGKYGPCLDPADLLSDYKKWKQNDSSRPVYLGLSRGVSDIPWHGRGTCTGQWKMYPEYIKACDILSFDIYPVNDGTGKLWQVPRGVDSLYSWSGRQRPVWCAIECTDINNKGLKPRPDQIRSEIWMAIIKGARGIIYFCHGAVLSGNRYTETDLPDTEMRNVINEICAKIDTEKESTRRFYYKALLSDAVMMRVLKEINNEILGLAAIINSPTVTNAVTVTSQYPEIPVEVIVKKYSGTWYIFAATMRKGVTTGSFSFNGLGGKRNVEVLGEKRYISAMNGRFEDSFNSFGVHLYRIGQLQ